MGIVLRAYQKEAMEKIVSAYNEGNNSFATIGIPAGFGVSTLLCESINKLFEENANVKVLCLFRRREEVYQFIKMIDERLCGLSVCSSANDYKNQSVLVITYAAYFVMKRECKFDLIICRDAEALGSDRCKQLLCEESKLILGVFNFQYRRENNIFFNAPCLFEIKQLYHNEISFKENVAVPMLENMGYTEIQTDNKFFINDSTVRPDIVAVKDGITHFIEIKTYRGIFNDRQVVWYAIDSINKYKRILEHKYTDSRFVAIMTCDIDENTKTEIANEFGIFVWDIKNLLYLCSENIKTMNVLEQITSYSLTGIRPVQPIEVNFSVKSKVSSDVESSYESQLIEMLNNCKTGRTNKADTEYEKICAKIIDYLFKNEFSQFSEQHTTNDDMFRMDIICGLKGTVAFWKFLIKYYNTKFVVFECKNYSHKIEQNLIYVTDKYLFNPVLRNVAFIISRKGFSENAQKAALGILKEQGKLILDLTDLDLEIMIKAKSEGKEPSDFLLDKVEKFLMGVSI